MLSFIIKVLTFTTIYKITALKNIYTDHSSLLTKTIIIKNCIRTVTDDVQ